MTRRFLILVALLSVTMVVTGCDFFRVLAGRPTSKEIEAKRAEILRSAQDDKVVAQDDKDSVPQQDQDSVQVAKPETAASERQDDGQRPHSAVPARPAGEKKRYYVIMGAFSSRENAEKYAERIKSFGYEPEFFGFTEGRTAVGVGGTDDPEEAKAFMRELKGQDFCPEGVWILDRKK